MWSNFHMHSNYCDGKGRIMEYVQSALYHHMISIGFSSHAPVSFPSAWCMKAEKFDDYIQEIDSIITSVEGIEIYKGLEVDFIPGMIGPKDFESSLDYTIGSVHFVDAFPDGRPWEIDGMHTTFLEGLDKIFDGNIKAVIQRYYELTRQMILTSCPTIVGHLDKIKVQNIENKFFKEEELWYKDEVVKTIDTLSSSGAIVEVNTRGLYQGRSSTPYPSPWILKMLYERNIPVTISSDTHHPSDIINRFPEIAQMLLTIGFEQISVLHLGSWQELPFNTHGIIR